MEVCLFLIATDLNDAVESARAPVDFAAMEALAASMDAIRGFILHVPVKGGAHDPYLRAEPPPQCVMQFYFDELSAMEATLKANGAAHALLDSARFPALAGCAFTQQAMAVRRFPVPEPPPQAVSSSRCTYLVSYEGEADDLNAWLGHYNDSHPPLMARFPGIREIEIYTRVDYCSDLAVSRSPAMQRNKVVFDSPEALNLALASPVRHELRDDFKRFPTFHGANLHYPMISHAHRWPR